MDLKDYRQQIDKIDDELVKLFCARMDVAAQIADYKKENGLPILVPAREREKPWHSVCSIPMAASGNSRS